MESKRFGCRVALFVVVGGALISADSLWAAGRGGFGGGRSIGGGRSFGGGQSFGGGRSFGGGSAFSGGRSSGGFSAGRNLGGGFSQGASNLRSGISSGTRSFSRPSTSAPALGGAVRSFTQNATPSLSNRPGLGGNGATGNFVQRHLPSSNGGATSILNRASGVGGATAGRINSAVGQSPASSFVNRHLGVNKPLASAATAATVRSNVGNAVSRIGQTGVANGKSFAQRYATPTLAGTALQNARLTTAGASQIAGNITGNTLARAANVGYSALPYYGYRPAAYGGYYPVVGTALRLAGVGYPYYGGYGYGGYGSGYGYYGYRPYGSYAVPAALWAARVAARLVFGVPYYGYGGYGYGGYGYSNYGYGSYYGGGSNYYSSTTTYQPIVLSEPTPTTTPATLSDAAQDFAVLGEADFRAGNYESAVRNWRHALVDHPDNGTLVLLLSQGLFAAGQYDEAAGALQHALAITPKEQWNVVVGNYTELYAEGQRYTDQLRTLEDANEKQPTPAQSLLLGYHYGFLNYPREAVRELDAGLKLAPDDPAAKQLRELFAGKIPADETPAAK